MAKLKRRLLPSTYGSQWVVWLLVCLWLLSPDRSIDSQEVGFSLPKQQRRAKVVVTDVDGTLMNSAHALPDAHREALRECVRQGIPVVFATGKHRGPWVQRLLSQVVDTEIQALSPWTLNAPGVFVQGLRVCNAHGQVVSSTLLERKITKVCSDLAQKNDWMLLAYTDTDEIWSNRADHDHLWLEALGEPPLMIKNLDDSIGVHKLIFLGRPEDEQDLRRSVESEVGEEASITVAIAGMVEVLPKGTSKAKGVRRALEVLDVDPSEVLALGDGENDVEMMELIRSAGGITASVANARPALQKAAEYQVSSCDEDGWSEAVHRWVL